jgi:hypothetical protein
MPGLRQRRSVERVAVQPLKGAYVVFLLPSGSVAITQM